ncbi:MAG: hypothetical protein HQK86_03240 [Nitrospinae bacterium]|nr:hypothetical protein [Nitrospinota bacterium]
MTGALVSSPFGIVVNVNYGGCCGKTALKQKRLKPDHVYDVVPISWGGGHGLDLANPNKRLSKAYIAGISNGIRYTIVKRFSDGFVELYTSGYAQVKVLYDDGTTFRWENPAFADAIYTPFAALAGVEEYGICQMNYNVTAWTRNRLTGIGSAVHELSMPLVTAYTPPHSIHIDHTNPVGEHFVFNVSKTGGYRGYTRGVSISIDDDVYTFGVTAVTVSDLWTQAHTIQDWVTSGVVGGVITDTPGIITGYNGGSGDSIPSGATTIAFGGYNWVGPPFATGSSFSQHRIKAWFWGNPNPTLSHGPVYNYKYNWNTHAETILPLGPLNFCFSPRGEVAVASTRFAGSLTTAYKTKKVGFKVVDGVTTSEKWSKHIYCLVGGQFTGTYPNITQTSFSNALWEFNTDTLSWTYLCEVSHNVASPYHCLLIGDGNCLMAIIQNEARTASDCIVITTPT